MSELKNLNEELLNIKSTNYINKDVENIIETTQTTAYKSVNIMLIMRNWLIGERIATEELKDKTRSENYGLNIIKNLSEYLTQKYGKGFTKRNLYYFYQFYKTYPNIVHTLRGQSKRELLSWSHYRILLSVNDEKARNWYEKESYKETWSSRTLQRNIDSQYYYRILKTQDENNTKEEPKVINKPYDNKLEFIKSPVITEFLGLKSDTSLTENNLESSIISNLQNFLIELGKGYAFVGRQYHIHTEKEDYYIDLVFYNYILKCFVLIDLKTKKISHKDIGGMICTSECLTT